MVTVIMLFSGLKEMLTTVADYNILMRDFPIKDLLAADSLENVCTAITTIFTHLRKIRSTTYPTDRAVGLIEAISKDVSGQLLKALAVHRLIQITYAEFEKVIPQKSGFAVNYLCFLGDRNLCEGFL